MPLLRILGVWFGLAAVVGGAIGSGILRSPGLVIARVGSPAVALGIWALMGAFTMLAAMCLTELALLAPKSGGFYVFARRALGPRLGFIAGSADFLSNCSSISFVAVAIGEYAGLMWPRVAGHETAIGSAVIVVLAVMQLLGIRVSSLVQEGLSAVKAAGFVVLVAAIVLVGHRTTAAPGAARAWPGLVAVALAIQLVLGSYDGWQNGAYFAGEDRAPDRNLPRAMIGGVAIVAGVYLLVNLSLLYVLPPDAIASSSLPVADAAARVFGTSGRTIVIALAMFAPLSTISVTLLCAPRILYAMGSDAVLPPWLAAADDRGTPLSGLFWTTALSVGFLQVGSFERVASVFAVLAIVSYLSSFVSLLALRRREPDLPRPFRVPAGPLVAGVVIAGNLAILGGIVAGAPLEAAVAGLALAAGYAVYHLSRTR